MTQAANLAAFGSNATTLGGTACQAWVNFNGTLSGTITPRASYNVSSITKNGTGDYTITFSTAFTDANYSLSGTAQFDTGGGAGVPTVGIARQTSALTTTTCRIYTSNTNNATNYDCTIVTVAFFR